jgi:fluoroquinolone transport system permease protein
MIIAFVMLLAIGGFAMGILLGFSLLENKDEQTILSIAVTPIKVSGYILFKTIYAYAFSIVGNLIMLLGIKFFAYEAYSFQYGAATFGFDNITLGNIIAFSFVDSLMVPAVGAVTAAISRNKIEGFAFMKSGGLLFMIPALVLLNVFSDWKQYFLGFAPNFWPLKGLLNLALGSQASSDLPYWAYLAIGAIYMIVLGGLAIRFYIKKTGLERG